MLERLKVPVLQAPTGSIAGPELCTAVTLAGGMGAMGVTWTAEDQVRDWIRKVRRAVEGRLFQVNYVLHFAPASLAAALDEGVPAVTFSWGIPLGESRAVRASGAGLGIQVGNVEGAKRALDLAPDFLVCQGMEAGGHVQSTTPLSDLLPAIVSVAGSTPVIAAGGIVDGADIDRVVRSGAAAAMLGTRFVATRESRAHERYKQALVHGNRTALTSCFDGGWPDAQHRVLRNSTLEAWEAAGCPTARRPGESDVVGTIDGEPVKRYDDIAPRESMAGEVESMCLYAGTGVSKIRDIPPAGELVERLGREAQNGR